MSKIFNIIILLVAFILLFPNFIQAVDVNMNLSNTSSNNVSSSNTLSNNTYSNTSLNSENSINTNTSRNLLF